MSASSAQVPLSDHVTALCTAYRQGASVLHQIKSKRRGLDISAQELELSITRGESFLKSQYDQIHRQLGQHFARGDEMATGSLENVTARIQGGVVSNLRAHYQQDVSVDFTAFQDICEAGQERAVRALRQLQQRIINSAPIETDVSSALLPAKAVNRSGSIPASYDAADFVKPTPTPGKIQPDSTNGTIHPAGNSMQPPSESLTPPTTPSLSEVIPRSASPQSRTSAENNGIARRNVDPYQPVAITVAKSGLFGIGKRTTVEPIVSPPNNPLVSEYLADTLNRGPKRFSGGPSITSVNTSVYEPDYPAFNSWQGISSSSPTSTEEPTESVCSFDSLDGRTLPTRVDLPPANLSLRFTNSQDLLPSEMNNYAGFCKGAWRQQIGDTKRAMEERTQPGGMYNQAKYWQCKHCNFEGRLVPINKKSNGYDTRVFKLVKGIQFRWNFMFKTHVRHKEDDHNPTKATFGCIFCRSEGRGTPVFDGIQSFMDHLGKHRDILPTGEVLYRMNCLVGRQATVSEDFDINFISPESEQT